MANLEDQHTEFLTACAQGDVKKLTDLHASVNDIEWHEILNANECMGFRWACEDGHVPVLEYLKANSTIEQWNQMLNANEYGGFRWACWHGQVPVLEYLKATSTDEQWNQMLNANEYGGFRWACEHDDNKRNQEAAHFIAPDMEANPKGVEWTQYNQWLQSTKANFAGCGLPLPEEEAVPSIPTRHFAAIGAKLALLKKEFSSAQLETMLGQINKPNNKKLPWSPPWQRINEAALHVSHADVGAIADSVREISRYAAYYVLKTQRSDDDLRALSQEDLQTQLVPIQQKIAKQMLNGNTLTQLKKMSDLWHQHRTGVKSGNPKKQRKGIRDFAEEGAWHTLMADDSKEIPCTKQGYENYQLVNLTTAPELDTEHEEMGHCVDGYVDQCKNQQFQIFSLQKKDENGNWQRATTLGYAVENGQLQPPHDNNHQGKNRRPATQDEKDVAEWFRSEVNAGRLNANFDRLGEIPTESTRSAFENMVGVELQNLTHKRMNQNFRAMASINKSTQGYPFGKKCKNMTVVEYLKTLGIEPSQTAVQAHSLKTATDAQYYALIEQYYQSTAPDKAGDMVQMIQQGDQMFKEMKPNVPIQTLVSQSGNSMIRFAEDDNNIYLMGLVSRTGTVPEADTGDMLNMRQHIIDGLKAGKHLQTTQNEMSGKIIDRMIKLIQKAHPDAHINDEKSLPHEVEGVGSWAQRSVQVSKIQR